MNKFVLSTLLLMGLSISALAVQTTPLNNKGLELDPKYGGISACELTSSTGTNAVLCTSGAGIVLDVVISSVSTTNYITFRDSATANTTSAELFRIDAFSSVNRPIIYPRFTNGLSVNMTGASNLGSAGSMTVIYTKDLK